MNQELSVTTIGQFSFFLKRMYIENIQTQLDKGKYCAGVFVDLKKDFDAVDHNILPTKLDYYGIRDTANE